MRPPTHQRSSFWESLCHCRGYGVSVQTPGTCEGCGQNATTHRVVLLFFLHYALSLAAQGIVIGPVGLCLCWWVCLFVGLLPR